MELCPFVMDLLTEPHNLTSFMKMVKMIKLFFQVITILSCDFPYRFLLIVHVQ